MSRAEEIRKRAEAARIIVTCSSGNEYVIGKASLRDCILVGELAASTRLVEDAVIDRPEDRVSDEVKAKAEASKPDWLKSHEVRSEIKKALGQVMGVLELIARYVYDPKIIPDSQPIKDPEHQVHESWVVGDIPELVRYISDYSAGTEVEKLKPFPGRRVDSDSGPGGEAVRTETVEPSQSPAR